LVGEYKFVLLKLAQQKAFELVWSHYGAWEFGRVAQRMGFREEAHRRLFDELQSIAEIVDHRSYRGPYPDWLADEHEG